MSSACYLFFQAEDGIRDLVRSRGLGDVYKRQPENAPATVTEEEIHAVLAEGTSAGVIELHEHAMVCLLYTSDAADERSSVDLGGRRIIKKKQ